MTPPIRVSVVIPTFKREGPLRLALDSLTSQQLTHGTFEVVLADDGSQGELDRCAADYAPRFAAFQMVTGPNAGPGIARNRGVDAARGEVVLFMDSDCLANPGWVENMTSAAETHDGYIHGPVLSSVRPIPPYVHSFMVHDELFCSGNFGMKRALFRKIGGFDPSISHIAEDQHFAERCRVLGIAPRYVPDGVIMHPPRLNRVTLPRPNERYYQALREFYRANENRRAKLAEDNRRLVRGALLKLAGAIAPAVLAPIFPPLWPVGVATMVGKALLKRRVANRRLHEAGEPFSVPLADAIRHGLQMPIHDLALYLHLRRRDLGGLTKQAIDAALGPPPEAATG